MRGCNFPSQVILESSQKHLLNSENKMLQGIELNLMFLAYNLPQSHYFFTFIWKAGLLLDLLKEEFA